MSNVLHILEISLECFDQIDIDKSIAKFIIKSTRYNTCRLHDSTLVLFWMSLIIDIVIQAFLKIIYSR